MLVPNTVQGFYYQNEEQKQAALASKAELERSGSYKNPVVTEIVPFTNFYVAEDYHKNYYEREMARTFIVCL